MPTDASSQSIFQRRKLIPFFALTAVILWGFAYPFIKLGMQEFQIAAGDSGSKSLFAGIRFLCAGSLILLYTRSRRISIRLNSPQQWSRVLLLGLVNTALHYFFFYVGLSNSSGSRSSILNSCGVFFLVFLACAVFPSEHLTRKKILGCILGFSGILLINAGGDMGAQFTLTGDGFIIANALCSAFGGLMTRMFSRKIHVLPLTGYSLLTGGLMLILYGLSSGGALTVLTVKGFLLLCGLVTISTVGFLFYNQLIFYHPVSEVAIYNSLIPAAGTIFSCLMLHETFYLRYLFAALLIVCGIFIINFKPRAASSAC